MHKSRPGRRPIRASIEKNVQGPRSTKGNSSMPSSEGKHELANSWERSETGLHSLDLANQKNSYNNCSSDERRNWFYGYLSNMDSTSTEVESCLDLNVLLSKMRNNLTFEMDTQINNSILYPYLFTDCHHMSVGYQAY